MINIDLEDICYIFFFCLFKYGVNIKDIIRICLELKVGIVGRVVSVWNIVIFIVILELLF